MEPSSTTTISRLKSARCAFSALCVQRIEYPFEAFDFVERWKDDRQLTLLGRVRHALSSSPGKPKHCHDDARNRSLDGHNGVESIGVIPKSKYNSSPSAVSISGAFSGRKASKTTMLSGKIDAIPLGKFY